MNKGLKLTVRLYHAPKAPKSEPRWLMNIPKAVVKNVTRTFNPNILNNMGPAPLQKWAQGVAGDNEVVAIYVTMKCSTRPGGHRFYGVDTGPIGEPIVAEWKSWSKDPSWKVFPPARG